MKLEVDPIGVVHSPFVERYDAPRQPRVAKDARATIELFPGHNFEAALEDVDRWEYLWVLFWFHRNEGHWRPKILPPRSTRRRGLFSTRTPHRPNPIGMSVVRLESVRGRILHIAEVDLLDGTPVLDLKPYVPWSDAIPQAKHGWLDDETAAAPSLANPESEAPEGDRPSDPQRSWEVSFAPLAKEQLIFLQENGVFLEERVRTVLQLGPHPHPYRRIKLREDGTRLLAVKEWRCVFRVEEHALIVQQFYSGYRPDALASQEELTLHREVVARWGALSP